MSGDITDKCNTEEIMPVSLAGVGVDDGLQVALERPPQIDPSQETIVSLTNSAKSESKLSTNAHAKSEQKDAALEVAQGPDSQDEQADEKNEDDAGNVNPEHKMDDKPYSVFTHNEKRIIVLCAGFCSFFSPISGQIYFPSLDAIAADLHVSYYLVNLTITTYLVSAFVRSRLKLTY